MKKSTLILLLLVSCSAAFAQKIKGSKAVTLSQKEIGAFQNLEISDNLEVFLVKGTDSGIEIEADDNLHEAVGIDLSAGTLRISAAQEVTGAKKFSVRVTYTAELVSVTTKENAIVTALTDLTLDNITIKTFDNSQFFATVKAKKFALMANGKSKIELNVKSEESTVELSDTSNLKALFSSGKLTIDMYQKSVAAIEGDAVDLKLRLDNNSNFTGKNLTSKTAHIATEDYTSCNIIVSEKAIIAAGGKSEIQLYGDPKIEVTKFADSAILYKKTLGKR